MKPLWFGSAGLAGLAILISATILVRPAGGAGEVTRQTSPKDGIRATRGHLRTLSCDGAEDLKFEKIPAGEKRETALRQLAGQRAADDPAAAESWAESIKLESEREVAFNHLAVAWTRTNPIMAIKLAERHHLSPGIVETIYEQWGKKDPDAAMRWAQSLPTKTGQENALQQIFTARAEIDPPSAALLVTQQLPPGPGQDEAVMTVLYHWLRLDEVAAAGWVENFPDGELRIRAESEIQGFLRYHAAASTGQ